MGAITRNDDGMKPMMIIAVCALLTACIKNDADPAPQKEIVFDAPVLSAVTKAGTTRNATEIMNMEEIDGALVGGASLEPLKFIEIINF